MSVSSTVNRVQYTITALPQVLTVTFPFYQLADLGVSDGATILTSGSDYTLTSGGGYNASNQLQTGTITVVSGGAGNVQVGDVVTIYRNISPTQTTSFSSTGLQTPLMIEQDDDKLTTLVQQLLLNYYNPFPVSGAIFAAASGSVTISGSTNAVWLGWITADTGGTVGCIDALNVTGIATISLPLTIAVSIGDDLEFWKLRPMAVGDPNSSLTGAYIVPVTNPNSLIWVRTG